MYAVITTGSKQFRVVEGQKLKVEKLLGEVGTSVNFDQVLMLAENENFTIGKPYVAGAVVKADIISHGRHDKILVVKFKRRKHHRKQMGHRQHYTEIQITKISGK